MTTQSMVNEHLKRLPYDKDESLISLFTNLNYGYVRENAIGLTRKWTDRQIKYIDKLEILAEHDDFKVFWCRLSSEHLYRTKERTIINKINRQHPYNIIIFSNKDDSVWEFVNIKLVSDKNEENKDKKKRKFVRRITIDNTDKLYTASERIAKLELTDPEAPPIEVQIKHDEAFDVEKVTEKFFEGIVRSGKVIEKGFVHYFADLKKKLYKQSDDKDWAHNFTMQFLSRIMFIYFIQKKQWLNNDPDFLMNYWNKYQDNKRPDNTFVDEWLGVLFFEAFNKKYSHPQWMPKDLDSALQLAPYLNGGLFTKNDWDKKYSYHISDHDFEQILNFFRKYNFTIAEDSPVDQEVAVDPEMIGKVYESLVNVSDEIDKQGEAGIFYTQRTEITLMCSLSLVDRLAKELGEKYRDIFYEMVFAYSEEEIEAANKEITENNLWNDLRDALMDITIVDPAVGSGSFLIGMLTLLSNLIKRANDQLGISERDYDLKKRIIGRSLYGVDVMEWAVHVCELRLWLQLVVETDMKEEKRTLEPLLPNMSFKIRQGDSLVEEVGGLNLSHLNLTDIPPYLKGKITKLKGEKLKYFNNDENRKFQNELQIKQEELNIFREILEDRIKNINERIKKRSHKQISIDGEEEIAGGKKAKKDLSELKNKKERFAAAYKSLNKSQDIPFVWDIAFVEIFEGDKEGFDIVIGNPPYVRQEKISDPRENEEDFTKSKWRERKKIYKNKLLNSVYQTYPDFFQYTYDTSTKKGRAHRKISKRNDLYVYFYFHGLSLLNEKGSFCFVTSNSWLDVGYGKDLQEFLIRKVPIRMIIDNQVKRSFKHADVNTVICLFNTPISNKQKESSIDNGNAKFVMFRTPFENVLNPVVFEEIDESNNKKTIRPEYRIINKTDEELLNSGAKKSKSKTSKIKYKGDKWGGKFLRAPDIYYTILEKGEDKLVRLGDIADVKFGIKTGANYFFYLTEEDIEKWNIEDEFLKPIIKSPRECKTIKIDPSQLKYNIFMCHKSKKELKGTNALKYIEWGEKEGFNQRATCSSRNRWYDINNNDISDFLWTMTYRNRFFVLFNDEALADARFYDIYCDVNDKLNMGYILNSTLTLFYIELMSRTYGGGGGPVDVKVYEVEDMLIVNPNKVSFDKEDILSGKIVNIIDTLGFNDKIKFREQEPDPINIKDEIDKPIFDALDLTIEERKELYYSTAELVQDRLTKAKNV